MDSLEIASRLEELERRSMYQEQTIQELSQRIYEQQKQIDTQEKLVQTLRDRVKSLERGDPNDVDSASAKAPHYIVR